MIKSNLKYLFIGFFSLLNLMLIAQSSGFRTYGLEQGLYNSQIETINQDEQGILWVGSLGGLAKYDGVSFQNFSQKNGLAEDWITSSFLFGNKLWLGHWGGGISVLNTSSNSIKAIKFDKHRNFNTINSIEKDRYGNLWFGTEGNGVFLYDSELDKFINLDKENIGTVINKIYEDQFNNIWVASDKGVFIAEFDSTYDRINPIKVLESPCTDILLVGESKLWFSRADSGVVQINANSSTFHEAKSNSLLSKNIKALGDKRIISMTYDQDNIVWIGTEGEGIYRFYLRNDAANTDELLLRLSNNDESQYFKVKQFFLDREKNIWLATDLGLHQYLGELFKLYNQADGLVNNLVWDVFIDKRDHVWAGTSGGVSKIMFPYVKRKKQYSTPKILNYTTEQGLPSNLVISICQDEQGKIWMATENDGIAILNEETQSFEYLTVKDGLVDGHIFDIKKDLSNNIWVGTKNGVSVINARTKKIKNYTADDGIGGDKVYHIYVDYKGIVWLCVIGGNLTWYKDGKFEKFDIQQGVKQKYIVGAAADKLQNLWFISYGDGVLRYDLEKFKHYPVEGKSRFTGNSPHFIVSDINSNVWVGLNSGMQKYDKTQDMFVDYGVESGFGLIETTENSAILDDQGNIWFGTLKGLMKLNPKEDAVNNIEPITTLEGLQISMENREIPEDGKFTYEDNNMTFNVLGLSLTNPQEVYYQYKLDGLNANWSPKTKESKISYSNLAPGKYVFNVRASNNSNVWNKEPLQYRFSIKPPFWMTKWFIISVVIALVAGVVFFVRNREKNLTKQRDFLESEVAERTNELVTKNENIEKQSVTIQTKNKQITDSINYAKSIQHAILPPDHKIKKLLPEYFLYYRPRDIVSGDFFWINKLDDKIYVAAVDCTGHGVPGAFMSLIGYNLLEKILNEHRISKPSDILQKLSDEITLTLRQEESDGVKDGMDLSLACIDFTNMKLEFSGAYNPLYLIRNKELLEFDGDRIPIGTPLVKVEGEYTNHEIDIENNDMLYLFSDGYVDQLGGTKRKKFKYKRFKFLLESISHLPMKLQYIKIDQTMKDWKKDVMQYDDMLIWGIRI